MNEQEFMKEFILIFASKNMTPNRVVISAYYEELKNLRYLRELLQNVKHNTFFKGDFPRIPELPEMIKIHDRISKSEHNKNIAKLNNHLLIDSPPEKETNKSKDYQVNKMNFCFDCHNILNIRSSSLWDLLSEKQIDPPENYKLNTKSKKELTSILKKTLGFNFKDIIYLNRSGNLGI